MNKTTLVLVGALLIGIACAPGAAACHRGGDLCMLYEENVAPYSPSDDTTAYFVLETADHAVHHLQEDLEDP